jgi:hypothetical protein
VLVDKEKAHLKKAMAPLKVSCLEGCSIAMDGWIDYQNRPLINIIISSILGTYFLKAINCSNQQKNTLLLKDQLCETIAKMGPSDVIQVQVVTNAAPNSKVARLMVQNSTC